METINNNPIPKRNAPRTLNENNNLMSGLKIVCIFVALANAVGIFFIVVNIIEEGLDNVFYIAALVGCVQSLLISLIGMAIDDIRNK
nr:MAG TPA: hypothetical protein [Caudoviricetes sp.]